MKPKKLVLAQTVNELKFILNRCSNQDNLFCAPLDLSTQIYCIENKIKFFNPLVYVSSRFHKQALLESERMIKSIDLRGINRTSEKITIKAFIRFRFNSAIFLVELLEKILEKEKISKIIVSGWDNYKDTYSENNYFISNLTKSLFKRKVRVLSYKKNKRLKLNDNFKYEIETQSFSQEKKKILITNLGYNLFRFVKNFAKLNKEVVFFSPEIEKLSLLKKITFKILNVRFFKFIKKNKNKKTNTFLPKVKYVYNKKFDLTGILNHRIKEENNNLLKNIETYSAIKKFFLFTKPNIIISNSSRSLDGQYLDCGKEKNIPLMCVPHGTISAYFNKYDRIYKKIIADSITYAGSNFLSQSKISNSFFNKEKKNYKRIIKSGNLIFNENNFLTIKPTKKILYAVTLKDFQSIQFLGVEMYYEYLDNLFFLNEISKKINVEILVKNHPSAHKFTRSLEKLFQNLKFTNQNIKTALSNVSLTISFSSTVIEDSLYSNKPVILLDRWKRYQHCNAEHNPNTKNKAIYYVTNREKLINCINTIFNSKKIRFNEYIMAEKSGQNINQLIKRYY